MGMGSSVISPVRMAVHPHKAMRTHKRRTFLQARRDLALSEVSEVTA